VLSLCGNMEGQVHVTSPRGSGAVFTVELPVAEQLGTTEIDATRPGNQPDASKRIAGGVVICNDTLAQRVLVVEDEPTVAQLTRGRSAR